MESLASLLKMKSPSNMGGAPGMSKRALDVTAGTDWMEPSEDELLEAQNTEGVGTHSSPNGTYQSVRSRNDLRDSGMQVLKRKLGMAEIEHSQKMEAVERPLHIKGQYDVAAAKTAAEASADRFEQQQDNIDARQRNQIAATQANLQVTQGGQNARQEDAQQDRRERPPTAGPAVIARERQALAAAVAKSEPSLMDRILKRPNPRAAELDDFDNHLAYAEKIVREMPDASVEEALAAMGQEPDSNELGQIQKFVLLLRGH